MASSVYKIEEEDSDKDDPGEIDVGNSGNPQDSATKKSKVSVKLTMAMIDKFLAQDTDSDHEIDMGDVEQITPSVLKEIPSSDPINISKGQVKDVPRLLRAS